MSESNETPGTQATSDDAGAGSATERLEQLGVDVEQWERTLRAFVREQPLLALLGALAVGYGIGRAVSS
jgi:hypothetical protein